MLDKLHDALSNLRWLEIEQIQGYSPRTRSFFQSILAGAISLPNFQYFICKLQYVTDDHITDIANAISEIGKGDNSVFSSVCIRCIDISLRQVQN